MNTPDLSSITRYEHPVRQSRTITAVALAMLLSLPLQAAEVIIFGDSWAQPMGPALESVFADHGHNDAIVHTTDFWGLASGLSSAQGLAYITEQLDMYPGVDFVQLSEGYNDVHCLLVDGVCTANWKPSMAGTQPEADILDTIVADTETIVDYIASIRPGVKVLLQSYDFMRPLAEIATKGTPVQNNAVHLKWADRVAALAQRKPTLTFVDLHGLMQVTYGFDGNQRTPYDPSYAIPPGDPSLPNPELPSPYEPFGRDRTHLTQAGFKTLAEGHYGAFYGPLLNNPESQIGAGHSGAWFNPETSGQGQLIDVDPASQYMFLAWFTYTDGDGVMAEEQHWFTAQGHYSGTTADLTVYETLGGQFAAPGEVATNPVGQAIVKFSDCGSGQMDYVIDTSNRQGSVPLQRLIPDSDDVCEQRAENRIESVPITSGMDGAWFDPDSPGQGFLLDVRSGADGGKYLFAAWFTYGDETESGQRWLTAQGPFEGSTATVDVYVTTGGRFDSPQPVETVAAGTMTINFMDCSNAVLEYFLTEDGAQGTIAIQRLMPESNALCEELAGME